MVDGLLEEVEELVVDGWEDLGWDRVNCQLYRGWCLGKHKPRIFPDGEGLVEAVGERIESWGLGLCGGVRVSAGEGASSSVVDLGDKALEE